MVVFTTENKNADAATHLKGGQCRADVVEPMLDYHERHEC